MTSVALGVNSSWAVQGKEIISPLGNERVEAEMEKEIRRQVLAKALEALQTDVKESTLFDVEKPTE